MHAGKMIKHNRITTQKIKLDRSFTLLVSESPDEDAALQNHAVNAPREGRVYRICRAKDEVVCGKRLYTIVAAAGGGGGWAVTNGLSNSFVN